jgi:transposase
MFSKKLPLIRNLFRVRSTPDKKDKRRLTYSRDKRPDCVQLVIALVVSQRVFGSLYEVLAGNTLDKTTLTNFLHKIEKQYGKAEHLG